MINTNQTQKLWWLSNFFQLLKFHSDDTPRYPKITVIFSEQLHMISNITNEHLSTLEVPVYRFNLPIKHNYNSMVVTFIYTSTFM